MVQEQHAGALVRGNPEPPTRGTTCDVRRAYTGIGTFESRE